MKIVKKAMNKGVAVDTIVWIILGIVVIGLLGYLLFTTFGKGKGSMESKECLAARLDCCCAKGSLADAKTACGSALPANNPCDGMPCSGPCT